MSVAFADREPTVQGLEKLRLLLSTFQDGTGMLALTGGRTLPGWRDFVWTVALTFNGVAQESKAVFDVLLTDSIQTVRQIGLSCKMRETLDDTERTGRVTIELSNAASKFTQHIEAQGIERAEVRQQAGVVGTAIVNLITQWHHAAAHDYSVDLQRSCYLVLSWSKRRGLYQLHQFPLEMPDPTYLNWRWPSKQVRGATVAAARLVGMDGTRTVFEWYSESGGQLKYYPLTSAALWASAPFRLEPLHEATVGLLIKVAVQFPELWQQANGSTDK